MPEMKITKPEGEPQDLEHDDTGLFEDAEVTPSAADMLAAQQAAMRQREQEAAERQAKKFGRANALQAQGPDEFPRGYYEHLAGLGSYRWSFADNGNVVELHNISAEFADDFDDLLTKHQVGYTRYRQVAEWRPE